MVSTDLALVERRARLAYELGRVRLALLGVAPVALIVTAAAIFAYRPMTTLVLAVSTVVASGAMLWYGREPQRAVLPGVGAGLVPLVLALCATHFHACGPEGCSTYCLPACICGGVVAGLAVAAVGHRRRAGLLYWLSASGLCLLTGAMGCSCVGYAGVVGLGVGFAGGVVPVVLRSLVAKKDV
jgi:hypothetical protein